MYVKMFTSIYDGTLRQDWRALVTFQQMLVLADWDGIVDMTPEAISGRTGLPVDIIRRGIIKLEAPDPASRTPDFDGRRVIRLDDCRDWGWQIVNHSKYRETKDADVRRAQNRTAQADWRQRNSRVSKRKQRRAHTDTDIDRSKEESKTCREQASLPALFPSEASPIRYQLPCKGGTYLVLESEVARLRAVFPEKAPRFDAEFAGMNEWIRDPKNAKKIKTLRGMPAFIRNWLSDVKRRRANVRRASDADYMRTNFGG